MSEKLEEGEMYRGPCGVLKDSAWLSAETIPADKDTEVVIEAVVRRRSVQFKNETKKGYGSLRFKGIEKELGLNSTHIAVLSKLFGPDTGLWFGRRIALYVDPNVSAFGKTVSAVRIRAKRMDEPKQPKIVNTTDAAYLAAHPDKDLVKAIRAELYGAKNPLDAEEVAGLAKAVRAQTMPATEPSNP